MSDQPIIAYPPDRDALTKAVIALRVVEVHLNALCMDTDAEQHQVTRLHREVAEALDGLALRPVTPPVLTGAHSFPVCVCARCGPPFRDVYPDWRDQKPIPVSWMTLCPTCGDKRCPGANDHTKHPSEARQ